jgi:hypothetical protein
VPRKLRTYDAETGERLAVVDLRQRKSKPNGQSDFYMAYSAESDDITTDERLSNFETRLMWFMLNRMEFGNVLHMKQVRMAKALKCRPRRSVERSRNSKRLALLRVPIRALTSSVPNLAGVVPRPNESKQSSWGSKVGSALFAATANPEVIT